jgi:hypothetical protein
MGLNKHMNRYLTLGLALAALSLPACQSMSTGSAAAGTQYLDAFHPSQVPKASAQLVDNVSYWDGDGLGGSPSVTIDLSEQKAYFYKGGQLAGVSAISSGEPKHPTITGNFKIMEKDKFHKSNLYGDYVDSAGNIVKTNIDVTKDPRPPGTTFDGAKMTHFMRIVGGIGMHEGFLPGYPASHGCIRMPAHMAQTFFHNLSLGTPVTIRH